MPYRIKLANGQYVQSISIGDIIPTWEVHKAHIYRTLQPIRSQLSMLLNLDRDLDRDLDQENLTVNLRTDYHLSPLFGATIEVLQPVAEEEIFAHIKEAIDRSWWAGRWAKTPNKEEYLKGLIAAASNKR